MKRVYVVIELAEASSLDLSSDEHLDDLAEDLLSIAHKVTSVTVYPTAEELMANVG